MSNMSYCRNRNTVQDLQDCADHITEPVSSDAEKQARMRLIALCREIVAAADNDPELELSGNPSDADESSDEDEDDRDYSAAYARNY